MRVILASKSPRRAELIKMLTDDVIITPSDADESFREELSVYENVMNAAKAKAVSVKFGEISKEDIILGADTVVVLDGMVYGKPKDKDDARNMIRSLSGRTHSVISGVCLIRDEKVLSFYDETFVTFDELTDEEIEEYISTSEPYDKAGSYAIQGLAGKHIRKLDGCYFNVVGLPVNKIYNELKNL
ncbi:MAG: septum formation protein Maf [Eubacteriaceae bacterium]|nr:septum formation protein Maf [Eubacteriaceae bacterium]